MSTSYIPTKLQAPMRLDTTGAACRNRNPELWFAEDAPSIRRAVAICRTCPIRVGCGDQAIRSGLTEGIYGGMTPTERIRLVREAS